MEEWCKRKNRIFLDHFYFKSRANFCLSEISHLLVGLRFSFKEWRNYSLPITKVPFNSFRFHTGFLTKEKFTSPQFQHPFYILFYHFFFLFIFFFMIFLMRFLFQARRAWIQWWTHRSRESPATRPGRLRWTPPLPASRGQESTCLQPYYWI